jgi:predicted tellurium resistance membrane protein TerC
VAAYCVNKIDSIWHAVWIILVADFTMSLDNVLAVAGVSKGNALQLWLSLGLSIPLVVFASTMLSKLMDKFPVILYVGAALLGKVGGEMMYTDPILQTWFRLDSLPLIWRWSFEGFCTVGVLLLAFWFKRRAAAAHAEK